MIGLFRFLLLGLGCVACPSSNPTTQSDEWPKLTKAFQQALISGKHEAVAEAAGKLALDNKKRSADLILTTIRTAPLGLYWLLIGALGNFSSEEALAHIGEEVLTGKSPVIKRDLIMSLRLSDSPSAIDVLRRVLREGTVDLKVSAIDELVDRLDYNMVPILLDIAEKDPQLTQELTRRVSIALRSLAKESPRGSPVEWREWWKGVRDSMRGGSETKTIKPGLVGATVVECLRPVRSTLYEDLQSGPKDQILVVKGEYDSVEEALSRLGLPHSVTTFGALKGAKAHPFGSAVALLINCNSIGDWPDSLVQQVREFVGRGGYLFVSDLGVSHIVRHAFPGVMQFKAGNLSAQSVGIVPARGSTGHPLLRGVDLSRVGGASRAIWQIDEGGPVLQYDERKVVPLIESPDLVLKRKPPAVAVVFSYVQEKKSASDLVIQHGGVYEEGAHIVSGKVLCVLSHIKKQMLADDGFALQSLLVNFLIEAKERFHIREEMGRKK